jgi:mRNA-degrading endonuclease RelE of RelBE toxin-antitoxin system
MTEIGAGGVVITEFEPFPAFSREFRKLSPELQVRVASKLKDLKANPRPPGLRFEKLKGYRNPGIYTIHLTGNYKISFEVEGTKAWLRYVGPHDEIDRAP